MSFGDAALVLAWVAIVLLALGLSGLMRQLHALQAHGLPRAQRVGLPPGTPLPEWMRQLVGDGSRPAVLLFSEAQCESCKAVLPDFQKFAQSMRGDVNVAIVTRGGVPSVTLGPQLRVVESAEAFSELRVPFVPVAAGVSSDGILIATEAVGSPERLEAFLRTFGNMTRREGARR